MRTSITFVNTDLGDRAEEVLRVFGGVSTPEWTPHDRYYAVAGDVDESNRKSLEAAVALVNEEINPNSDTFHLCIGE